jgi:hypothetical protein
MHCAWVPFLSEHQPLWIPSKDECTTEYSRDRSIGNTVDSVLATYFWSPVLNVVVQSLVYLLRICGALY